MNNGKDRYFLEMALEEAKKALSENTLLLLMKSIILKDEIGMLAKKY